MNDSRSCDEVQMMCSTGYCWSGGVPSVDAGIPGGGLVENKVIEIGGTYTVTISATFRNCTFRMSGDARINISPDGNTPINVVFENCNLYGCGDMWQGIAVNSSAADDDFTFDFIGGNIEDAYIGLRLDEFKGNYSIADNSFRNNHIGISNVRQNGGALNAAIVRNHFWQSAELAERTGSLDDPFVLPDYPMAHAGVKYVNVVSSIGVYESVGTGNTTNLFECLRYGILTENGRVQSINNTFQIMGLHGVFATDGAVRVVTCEFLVSGNTGILTHRATLKAQKNLFSGVWDEGIHSEQNLNSESIIINERNAFIIADEGWFHGIYVERPQALSGKHCIIDGNTFTVTSDPANLTGCIVIHIEDFVAATDVMEVSWNEITVNSTKGGVIGYWAPMGNSDQFNVHDNTMYFGTSVQTSGNFGFFQFSSGGQNLSDGHVFRDNTVTGIDTNALQCGFHTQNLKGIEFCNNIMDHSYHGMHFIDGNNVDLRSNYFENHKYGLKIAGSAGRIGIQTGKGNQWDLNPDAVEVAAQNESTQALNSQFLVTQGNSLPWLPDDDKLDPDPSVGAKWFVFSVDEDNDDICLSPLVPPLTRKLTPSENEAVLNTSTLSGVALWDLKRDVYAKLLVYPELRPTSSAEETFYNSLSGTLIDSLGQVTKQIREGLSLSSGDQSDLDTYRAAMEAAFESLVTLDASLDYSDLDNLTDSWFLQRDTLLQLIASNGADEVTLENTRNIQVNADLADALTYNATISSLLPYATSRKTVNELHISRLSLPMSEILYGKAITLVQLDVEDAGAATKDGIRFLGPCDQGEYFENEKHIEEEERYLGYHSAIEQVLLVSPNPNSGLFEVRLPQKTGGSLMVHNVQGQNIKTLSVASGTAKVSLDLGPAPAGLYWVVLSDELGKVLGTTKIFVSH
jgi:hypothetical protein